MDNMNFSSPERRQVHDVSEVNGFLSKMYGYMGLAVLVSAIATFLTMTVFRAAVMQMPTALMWIILIIHLVYQWVSALRLQEIQLLVL